VPEAPLEVASRLFAQAVAALRAAAGSAASEAELLGVLTVGEGVRRAVDQAGVAALADLERRGTFGERGYRSSSAALGDLLGWERAEARRHLTAAEHVQPRAGLDGTPLPPRLPATAAAFETGTASLRQVEVVARVLGSDAAGRLDPQRWAGAEAQLTAWIPDCTPTELQARGEQLLEALDADGPEPDERPEPSVNELHLLRRRGGGGGGRLVGRFDDAAMFDAIATLVEAQAAPRTAEDDRTPAQRQAEALADACGWVLAHADTTALSSCGGRRPQLNVVIGLADLERRARAACLDFGGTLSPASLRMLACDAAVVPVVLGGAGQPLDVGRATRSIPDGLRRAVAVRDGGCARCRRPPSWCEVHHLRPWEHGGETKLANLVMLCRVCHRLVHHADWDVRLVGGSAEFVPPVWIDPQRRPRRRPPPLTRPA
jgi:Domain of unknown function (DUF222)/HNH endonuclease